MATAKSVDEYIDNLNRKYTNVAFSNFIALFIVSIFISYYLAKYVFPQIIDPTVEYASPQIAYFIVLFPIGFFIWELYKRTKETGDQIWNILCPECDEYIPLHQFACEPPCEEEYTDRSIIEGCKECSSRYKKEGHDAFRWAECDDCGHKLEFSEPYDFKKWSVLSKGQTWETETLVVKNETAFSASWRGFFIAGLLISGVPLVLPDTTVRASLGIGLYVVSLGVLLLLIHKILYGDMKRIPNPTFKRQKEPEEIYVYDNPIKWRVVLLVGTLGAMLSGLLVYSMVFNLLWPPHNPQADVLVTYTPFEIAWRLILFVLAIIVIVFHSRLYKEYKKVPNPRYKEESS